MTVLAAFRKFSSVSNLQGYQFGVSVIATGVARYRHSGLSRPQGEPERAAQTEARPVIGRSRRVRQASSQLLPAPRVSRSAPNGRWAWPGGPVDPRPP